MAMHGFLDIPGIKGSAQQKHVLGKIVVVAATHEIPSKLDDLTGLPTGKAVHKPLIVTKDCDVASFRLYEAMEKNEKFGTVQLDFWRMPPRGGLDENHCSVIMNDVQISSIRLLMDNNLKDENANVAVYEELGLSYG